MGSGSRGRGCGFGLGLGLRLGLGLGLGLDEDDDDVLSTQASITSRQNVPGTTRRGIFRGRTAVLTRLGSVLLGGRRGRGHLPGMIATTHGMEWNGMEWVCGMGGWEDGRMGGREEEGGRV